MQQHQNSIISKKVVNVDRILPGNIIMFNYSGQNVNDTKPLVFVLPQLAEVTGGGKKAITALLKKGGSFAGLNLHFLNDYAVDVLMEEDNFRKLKQWNLYKAAFRTYSLNKTNNMKLVEFQSQKQLKAEEKIKRLEGKSQEPKKPKQPEPPQQPEPTQQPEKP